VKARLTKTPRSLKHKESYGVSLVDDEWPKPNYLYASSSAQAT
jgi:hypothetical protein